eukprot:656828-Amorphochlora_amoeboformis.AAC.1
MKPSKELESEQRTGVQNLRSDDRDLMVVARSLLEQCGMNLSCLWRYNPAGDAERAEEERILRIRVKYDTQVICFRIYLRLAALDLGLIVFESGVSVMWLEDFDLDINARALREPGRDIVVH